MESDLLDEAADQRSLAMGATTAPEHGPAREPKPKAVLLVEDERVTRKAMALLLAASGYPTQSAESAEEALRMVEREGVPHIALIDLDLPGMNGLELISRLGQAEPSMVPVLITAVGDDTLVAALRERGVNYLRKPVNFDSLLDLLGRQARH